MEEISKNSKSARCISPIILFVYNRFWHTYKTIEALKKNKLANQSILFIYSDGAKSEKDNLEVQKVRNYIKSIKGFKLVKIVEREKNYGLANNIINGVTEIINKHNKIIVMEDDIVTSPSYLSFMNQALNFYEREPKVWHISGWNYPFEKKESEDVFFWRLMNCWGWATWKDRWEFYERNPDKLIKEFTKNDIKEFNIYNAENFWGQVVDNSKGKINTWAIFWYATIFKNNGLCLNPVNSMVNNIGHDSTGTNSSSKNIFESKLSINYNINYPHLIRESQVSIKSLINFNKKKSRLNRFIKKISLTFLNEHNSI